MKTRIKTQKQKVHIVAPSLLNPTNPITINLIGAGGTGSEVLSSLARTHMALTALNHPGLFVRLFDDDVISIANKGRLLFTDDEVGLYKSVAFINRINRFCGTNWKAYTEQFNSKLIAQNAELAMAQLTISCVDVVQARFEIAKVLTAVKKQRGNYRNSPLYWIDYGNAKDTGQVVLSTVGDIAQPKSKKFLPVANLDFVTTEFKDLLMQSETGDNLPSCSLAEALGKQDLFINPVLAKMGGSMLWQMFREGMLFERGFFLNLKKYRCQPLMVA